MKRFILDIKDCFFKNHTGAFSAALAYYLLFSIFPVIGMFNILLSALSDEVRLLLNYLPSFTADILSAYMEYVSSYPGSTLFSAALIAFLYMPFRAIKFIFKDMRLVYGEGIDMPFLKKNVLVFIYTIMFLALLVFTAVVMVAGSDIAGAILGEGFGRYIKYLIPEGAMFFLLCVLYKSGTKRQFKKIYKGAMAASLLWSIGSVTFSVYVNTLGKYTVVYGSLGSVMAFFVWIYFTCFCVLMGIRLNYMSERFDIKVQLKYN